MSLTGGNFQRPLAASLEPVQKLVQKRSLRRTPIYPVANPMTVRLGRLGPGRSPKPDTDGSRKGAPCLSWVRAAVPKPRTEVSLSPEPYEVTYSRVYIGVILGMMEWRMETTIA